MADVAKASSVAPRRVSWLWRERIPRGMISVVAGKPDQGKGLLSAHIAADVSKRGENVLYSAIEDAADMMTRPRLEAAGADLDRVLLWRFRLPLNFEELVNHVLDNDVKLVVMDPFAAHLSGGISRHSDNVREVLTPLSRLCEESGCAVLVTEHALKRVTKNSHPLQAIGGTSSGLPAASRMAFVFGLDPDDADRRILACAKSNLRETPKAFAFETDTDEFDVVGEVPALIPQGEIEFDARRLLSSDGADSKPGRKPDKRAAAAEWLTMYLANAGRPVKAGDVIEDAKQFGLAAKTVRRAADEMGVVRNPPGGGRNCTWDLNDDVKKVLGLDVKPASKQEKAEVDEILDGLEAQFKDGDGDE